MAKSSDELSTGQVAKILTNELGEHRTTGGYSRQAVRRLIDVGELSFAWSRERTSTDARGFAMRGHRRIPRADVDAFVERERERFERENADRAKAERATAPTDSDG
jgi:hypothetical protein